MEEWDFERVKNLEKARRQLRKGLQRAKAEMKKSILRIQLRNTERNLNNLLN